MSDPLFRAAGELRADYEAVDWAASPLGPPAAWSTTLRTTVALMLRIRFPITLIWGPDEVLLYNEAYVGLIGDKHPAALGRTVLEIFPEAYDQLEPLIHTVRDTGQAVLLDDSLVPLVRHGFLEECRFTFAYSPVVGPDGVEGIIDVVVETTPRALSQRRLALVTRLGDAVASAREPQEVLVEALHVLRDSPDDLVAADVRPAADPGLVDPRLPIAPSAPLGHRDLLVDERADGAVVWLALTPGADLAEAAVHAEAVDRPDLVVRPSPMLVLDEEHEEFLRLVAATIGGALDRVETISRERRTAAAERALSRTLQLSLLTMPSFDLPGLDLAVRYQPAEDVAQVGGDWHDSFRLADGDLMLAVGDVAGHDSRAAAGMAQLRNLLRGIACTTDGPPSVVLERLDRTLATLAVPAVATAILARVGEVSGGRCLTWSNAGHPPPFLVDAHGRVRLLDSEPEPLLGVAPGIERSCHDVALTPGSVLLMFTDGLVERRGEPFDAGMEWLRRWLELRAAIGPLDDLEALVDELLAEVVGHSDDDVALVAVRVV
ncbi:serine/threonine-protein phosphatase [Nocardioides sp. TRM66260-LWL]|uniref:PP2C family protein-serine/threonine phosphatase n=1 Tax=Nocardioides sp. TRM66260-LWL TaxID=2874478 RepID=UPI001CC33422|nr:PP2C family protein-serine/threonine phosphatase [Nocardioides sp. TRM66260-LWL]MBZ5736042.1 serine/threonine-protein phosphatase [Nocardioides sp. TRM66260-LWL]